MSRRLLCLLTVLAGILLSGPCQAQQPFVDIPQDHWAYSAVQYMANRGLVTGYPDGMFRGKRSFTRYEFAPVLARIIAEVERDRAARPGQAPTAPATASNPRPVPKDVPADHPAYESISTLYHRAILTQSPFNGREKISRFEMVRLLYRVGKPLIESIPPSASGVPRDVTRLTRHPDYQAIVTMYQRGVLNLREEGELFSGDMAATRYQLAIAGHALLSRGSR